MFSVLFPLLDVVKLIIASVTSVIFSAFACLTLAGSAVALVVSTPVFLLFSPILVPATIATTLLTTGLASGVTLGATAIGLILGLIRTAGGMSLAESPAASPAGGVSLAETGPAESPRTTGGVSFADAAPPAAGGVTPEQIIKRIIALLKKLVAAAKAARAKRAGGAAPAAPAAPAAAPAAPPTE